jgi:hypothetical protein
MKGRLKKTLLTFACLMLSSFAGIDYAGHNPSKAVRGDRQIETVSFCELTNHPERYVNKLIKTSAIFLTHFPDVWFMYDQNCSEKNNRVSDYLNCKSDVECDRLKQLTSLHRDGDGEKWRNKMVVIGELHIVNHQNRSGGPTRVLKFAVSDIESVSPVPSDVAWP